MVNLEVERQRTRSKTGVMCLCLFIHFMFLANAQGIPLLPTKKKLLSVENELEWNHVTPTPTATLPHQTLHGALPSQRSAVVPFME